MSTRVKTAISIPQDLFDAINHLAEERHVSRSKLFMMAVEEFLENNKNRQLLAQINAAYSDTSPDAEETQVQHLMKKKQARNIEQETW
jgi:metal-responsive CopG/Arc/MetJ family transcriptional regulator